jgi:dihydrofolate reductase
MPGRVRVHNFSMSLDGYCAGPDQGPQQPLGIGGLRLHEWLFPTATFLRMQGMEGGDRGVDDTFAARRDEGLGATIMGRNMFGPVRGPWGDEGWRGWWGDDPPFHHPVFVLTRHPRAPITMQGGTTFHFVTEGIDAALAQAAEAAGGLDVCLGGGVSTIQQFLRAGLIDDLHIALVPILLGSGERLFDHLDGGPVGYECAEFAASPSVAHIRLAKASASP